VAPLVNKLVFPVKNGRDKEQTALLKRASKGKPRAPLTSSNGVSQQGRKVAGGADISGGTV